MIDLSDFDLEELYDLQKQVQTEIQDKEDKLRDFAFEQENNQLEEDKEEYYETML